MIHHRADRDWDPSTRPALPTSTAPGCREVGGKLWAGRGEARTEVGTVSILLWQTLVRLRAQQGEGAQTPLSGAVISCVSGAVARATGR